MFSTSAHQTVCYKIIVDDEARPELQLVADSENGGTCEKIPERTSVVNTVRLAYLLAGV